jgi:o-succinylbenzoate---CoA ligase
MERIELARFLGAGGATGGPLDVTIAQIQTGRFMEEFGSAVAAGGTVFVADPSWGAVEREQFAAVVAQASGAKRQSQIADGKSPTADRQLQIPDGQSEIGNQKSKIEQGWLCLPTGGSSGALRWALHDQDTLSAAVHGCCGHFEVSQINAVGVLPLHHVSGLMAWMRCALTGGRYVPWDWAVLEAGRWPQLAAGDWFLSLVPTQLQRLLSRPEATDWLRRFRAVFIGGGPAWPELLDRAAEARLPLAPGYGMTETAAMVAALRPEEFLQGRRGCGAALPHAGLTLGEDGVIEITTKSLFRGYYPAWREAAGAWRTEDLGRIDEQGGLHVLGRRDAIIISGGKKIEPAEVEAVLRATGQFVDVAVVAVPDAEWGEMVVACYPADANAPDLACVDEHLAGKLASHKRPKRYMPVAWPRKAQGKINRQALVALAAAAIKGGAG